MAPFLFLMVLKGLADLVRQALASGKLKGIQIGKDNVDVSLIQFVDDTPFLYKSYIKEFHVFEKCP